MGKKILVIEDDPSTLRLMEYTLEHEGYEVILARDGLEGVKKVQEEHPDMVILDVMLPGLDGYEICYQLRQQVDTSLLPILMVSARASRDDRDTGLRVGADDYLTKPVEPSVVVAKVKAMLTEAGQSGPVAEEEEGRVGSKGRS